MWKYRAVDFGIKKKIDGSLQANCIDILISSLLFDFNNDILINSGVDQVRKLVKADKMAFIVLGFDRQNGTYCVILSFIIIRTKYFVIARSKATWQSPGRDTK